MKTSIGDDICIVKQDGKIKVKITLSGMRTSRYLDPGEIGFQLSRVLTRTLGESANGIFSKNIEDESDIVSFFTFDSMEDPVVGFTVSGELPDLTNDITISTAELWVSIVVARIDYTLYELYGIRYYEEDQQEEDNWVVG